MKHERNTSKSADENIDNSHYVAEKIINILFNERRMVQGESDLKIPREREYGPHLQTLLKRINENKKINMILPAFPGKSPNKKKTLGVLPDLAEKTAMKNLSDLCIKIKSIYEPGAQIIICSDGYCFSDVVEISDEEIEQYLIALKQYVDENHPDCFTFYDLDDHFEYIKDLPTKRDELLVFFGEPIEKIKNNREIYPSVHDMYIGITKFLFDDMCGMEKYAAFSKNNLQKRARTNAYRVIQRSNAWSQLVEKIFPDSLRLSIHPQKRESRKIGVSLAKSDDNWLTPWHSVALKRGKEIVLFKRYEIDENSTAMVYVNGSPSHFVEI
ncbi:L-tyrosine/L-tryptophan isonitrile synthase family protein [Erwinia sp. AnSW2-5]|uniref:L-tyrosine/L-tryptophan isonitrile synthase family protein n=1 Tax=Erwinia sp. AnSW2-5 TaxID=3367692 RepID=UPI00385BD508